MMSVHEICQATGVTRKTLFHYDKIGLLKPTRRIGPQKSKMYGQRALARLDMILRYQRAGLTLNEIKRIIDDDREQQMTLMNEVILRMETESELLKEKITEARIMLGKIREEADEKTAGDNPAAGSQQYE